MNRQRSLPSPALPRWAQAAGIALLGFIAFQFWLIRDWRALALERASVDVAARSMCADTLDIAQRQSELMDAFSAQAEKAFADLAICRIEGVVQSGSFDSSPTP